MVGDAAATVTGLSSLDSAQSTDITHLSSVTFKTFLPATQAGAVILSEKDADDCPCHAIVVDQPYLAFARVSQLFAKARAGEPGVHASAVVAPGVHVPATSYIGPNVVLCAGVEIGEHVWIEGNTLIGERSKLGDGVAIFANASIYSDVHLGANCTIHSGAVIGGAGFGFTPRPDGVMQEIAQIGGVRIGANVSVGANTTIDCGAIEDTVIEEGVKIDNLVQIAHNCHIGAHTLICGKVGLVGSTRIGRHCVLAGGVGVGGDKPIELCDGVICSATTHVTQSITEPGVYSGSSMFQPHKQWLRNAMRMPHLDALFKRVRNLERRLENSAASSSEK